MIGFRVLRGSATGTLRRITLLTSNGLIDSLRLLRRWRSPSRQVSVASCAECAQPPSQRPASTTAVSACAAPIRAKKRKKRSIASLLKQRLARRKVLHPKPMATASACVGRGLDTEATEAAAEASAPPPAAGPDAQQPGDTAGSLGAAPFSDSAPTAESNTESPRAFSPVATRRGAAPAPGALLIYDITRGSPGRGTDS